MGVFRREICLGKVAMSRTGYACKGITKLCLSCDNVLRLCVFVCVYHVCGVVCRCVYVTAGFDYMYLLEYVVLVRVVLRFQIQDTR